MKRIGFFIFLFITFSFYTYSFNKDNFDYAGFFKTELWIENNPNSCHQEVDSFKNTFDLSVEYKFSDNWAFFIHGRYFYDAIYDIRDGRFDANQVRMGHTQRQQYLRDCYLDYTSDTLDVRLGKQQVVWGSVDLPVLDTVMPWDMTWWLLPDLADIRIPLWMIKVEYSPYLNSSIQFLLIPDFEANRCAPPGDTFTFRSFDLFMDAKSILESQGHRVDVQVKRPGKQFSNSRIGLRWRSMIGDLEYTLNYLWGYSPQAYTYFDGVQLRELVGFPPQPRLNFYYSRQHKITQIIGFSFSKSFINPGPLEGWTFKGEFAYFHNDPANYGIPDTRSIFTEQTDKYKYVLAAEKEIITNWTVSFQFYQFITKDKKWIDSQTGQEYVLLNNATYGAQDKIENIFALKILTDFMHERLKTSLLVVYQDDNEGRLVPKLEFELKDNLWLKLGYVHFWGRPSHLNGEFRNRDQIFLEVKYTF